jgi:hypothetical protein
MAMRWWFLGAGILLLVWLASGDAKGQPVERTWPQPPPGPVIQIEAFGPGAFGAMVDLRGACQTDPAPRTLVLHYDLDGTRHRVVRQIGCPESASLAAPIYVVQTLDLRPAAVAHVRNLFVEMGAARAPFRGYSSLDVAGPAKGWSGIGWAGADVGLVAAVGGVAWWRDPTRRAAAWLADVVPVGLRGPASRP